MGDSKRLGLGVRFAGHALCDRIGTRDGLYKLIKRVGLPTVLAELAVIVRDIASDTNTNGRPDVLRAVGRTADIAGELHTRAEGLRDLLNYLTEFSEFATEEHRKEAAREANGSLSFSRGSV